MDKIAIVTGASRGIGAAPARLLGRDGYAVAVNYNSSPGPAEAVVRDIEAGGGRAIAVQGDTGNPEDVQRLFETVDREFGRLTALVNNAGIHGPRARFEDVGVADMQETLRINALGYMMCAQQAARRMSTKRGGKGGAIVNVTTGHLVTGGPGESLLYGCSKAAGHTLTMGLAQELAAEGVRVNAVSPGLIDTEMPGAARVGARGPGIPMGRAGRPEEIAEGIVWLLSDKASYCSAASLRIGGGRP